MEKRKYFTKAQKKPRKMTVVKPSKYEVSEAILSNKKYWQAVFDELDTVTTSPTPERESRELANVLPPELYEKVCNTLGIPIVSFKVEDEPKCLEDDKPRRLVKYPSLSHRKTLTIDREMDSDTDVEFSSPSRAGSVEELNVHQEFLRRPEREQVTWATRYLQPEREEEKTLVRRADDLTDRIAQEFCEYMKQLGGNQQSQFFTPKAIKELFQVEQDSHAARSLRVVPQELACVQDNIAAIADAPEKGHSVALEREVSRDIAAERRPQCTTAFGQSLPHKEQWRPPRNDTRNLWRSARHVPQDLVTLKTVWEGITNLRVGPITKVVCFDECNDPLEETPLIKYNLIIAQTAAGRSSLSLSSANVRPLLDTGLSHSSPQHSVLGHPHPAATACSTALSVREYCRWMIDHPEYRRAPYLRSLGMFDANVLSARQSFDTQQEIQASIPHDSSGAPAPIENLRRRLSQLADSEEQ